MMDNQKKMIKYKLAKKIQNVIKTKELQQTEI